MVAPVYLTPQYITYDMLANQLAKASVIVTNDDTLGATGIYIGVVNDLIAKGEAYIIETILSNYVQIPLTTIKNTPFDDLVNDPVLYAQYGQTYAEIRDLFMSSAYWQIYKSYFGFSGNDNNGNDIIKQYSNKISIYTNSLLRLDQAGNPLVKNAFAGLKVAINGSQRIAKQARTANGIPQGGDQAWSSFGAVPNLRWGCNR